MVHAYTFPTTASTSLNKIIFPKVLVKFPRQTTNYEWQNNIQGIKSSNSALKSCFWSGESRVQPFQPSLFRIFQKENLLRNHNLEAWIKFWSLGTLLLYIKSISALKNWKFDKNIFCGPKSNHWLLRQVWHQITSLQFHSDYYLSLIRYCLLSMIYRILLLLTIHHSHHSSLITHH